jgi:beta-lactamase regulating signal transducer with metallopeptidase domain/predicted  nucleic acid-binding Zn-ribbon protein
MPPAILHASWSLLAHVAGPAARALVLGCFAGLALAPLWTKGVRVRLLVWRAVLLAALAMPLLTSLAPPFRVLLPLPRFPRFQTRAAPVTADSAQSVARPEIPSGRIRESSVPLAGLPPIPSSSGAALQNSLWRPRDYPWPVFLLAIYAAVAAGLLTRLFVGLRLAGRLEASANPIRDSAPRRSLIACASRTGLALPPRLAESEALSVPLTLGVRRPLILLPASWRAWQRDELEAVLTHEVSHVARQDALFQRLALFHRALFWFNPLSWWLARHLADLAEQASDEAALAGGADRRRYAETLLGFFAALETSPARVWWQGLSMAQAGQAEKRVDRILAWRGAMPNKLRKSLVVGLAAAALPVVALTATLHTEMYTEYDDQGPANRQAPAAPVALAPSPSPAAAPQAASAPEPPPGVDTRTLKQAEETLRRNQDLLRRATETLSAAQSRLSSSATEEQMENLRAAEAAYQEAVSRYQAGFEHLQELEALQTRLAMLQAMYTDDHPEVVKARTRIEALEKQEQQASASAPDYRFYHNYEPRFVIVSKNSDSLIMSGSDEDAEHAKALRSKIPGDFIWFQRDEKSYVIRHQATVDRAKALWKPQEELGRKQEELGKQQEALGKQQEALEEKMEQVRVKIPDMTAQMQKLEAEMKQLSANGGTVEQVGDFESEIGELQSRIGEIQADAGHQQGEIGHQQGELGRKQGELGRQQGELGRQQGELARQANRQMKQLLDDALAKGLAQPEESLH